MRTDLKADEIGFYREKGFLVVPDFLDADDLARWREANEEALETRGDAMFAGPTALGADASKREPTPCPVPAGGACFHNGLTAHGAGANMTHGRRRAMTCVYRPDGSTFNGIANVLPPAYNDSLEIGDVLDSDEHNPLIFGRARAQPSPTVR